MAEDFLLIALEGGGTRSQAALVDSSGRLLKTKSAADVNTNFTSPEQAQRSVLEAVRGVLEETGVHGGEVAEFACALVGSAFGKETFGGLCPKARYHYFTESDVVFARGGIYRAHGVAAVAATGATAWGVRADDGRTLAAGGWGSLLGDEGSAYAMGLMGLRAAARSFENRLGCDTQLVTALAQALNITTVNFHRELVELAYGKPLSRAEIAALAVEVSRLANTGDAAAMYIVQKVANDFAALPLHVAHHLFTPEESFVVIVAGGLLNAGESFLGPLRKRLKLEFPQARLAIGSVEPALALARLALNRLAAG